MITTDDEDGTDYFLGKIGSNGDGAFEDLARVPFAARALAYDGSRFWTTIARPTRSCVSRPDSLQFPSHF